MTARLRKFLITSAHVVLLVLSFKALFGGVSGSVGAGCIEVCGLWLALALITLPRLFRKYYDNFARIRTWIMAVSGLVLGAVAFIAGLVSGNPVTVLFSLAALLIWYLVITAARRHLSNFVHKGFGYLPKNVQINPPVQDIRAGDVILTSGRIAARTRNSVGHMEVVLNRGGKLFAFSSYMEKGIVFHSLRALCAMEVKSGSHYVVVRPKGGFTAEQNERALKRADEMQQINDRWTESETQRRTALVNRLLPERLCRMALLNRFLPGLKAGILKRYLPTGYDWWGTYMGSRFSDRWTCMGACLAVLHAAGVPTAAYGKGLFGLGSGLFTPFMPVRVMDDPNFFALTQPAAPAAPAPATN